MKRIWVFTLLSILPTIAAANSFTAEGTHFEAGYGYTFRGDRNLVEDGSFENGTCLDGGSSWTCSSDNGCDWIADLVPLGLWNFDGNHIAWLGGFCAGQATCSTTICQELPPNDCPEWLFWYWMVYVVDGGRAINVTVNGEIRYTYAVDPADHLADYMNGALELGNQYQDFTVCFELHNEADCAQNLGDNYFFDYVERVSATPTVPMSLSTVKAIY